ncbi:MAG: 1,4-dihydroxy-6-naphthoate synthase [Chitinophagaceae bacterium]|nr:1,4-dihydroxy-6-naphthoate synthase [Chitinophagaceae bacterium]
MKLTLGFSPCPNDTFIFDALVSGKIDTSPFSFEVYMEDVETLNQWAISRKLDITKISFPAFFRSLPAYILLGSGGAIGYGTGPFLISAHQKKLSAEEVCAHTIVLPGRHTTADFLFHFAYPAANQKIFLRFDQIEDYLIENGKSENLLGVIIHESRFTYQQKGLYPVADLGKYWEEKTGSPVPLGGIAIRRDIEERVCRRINHLIYESVCYALDRLPLLPDFVKKHAQALDEDVMRKHIDLYVNDFTVRMGSEGEKAVQKLYEIFCGTEGQPRREISLFL